MTEGTRVGTVIEDKYRLDEQIGRGSMGAVFRGTQLMVDRSVAVKLLHPTFAGHEKIQARFEVDAKAIARLNHPNCITLFDFGYSEKLEAFYTVVEYIDGTSLEKLINQRPSVARIVDLIRQIASALGHAHHHGILHRDLKPENIMLAQMTDGSDIIKVLDFGIAQIMKGSADEDDDFEADRLTRVGEVFGTPPYMSPEQAQSTRNLSPATDLYSLGIIFYELLEGRLPFFADNPIDIMAMHISEPPPPMTRSDVPESIQSIVLQMLEKLPNRRPEGGDKIVALLEAIPDEKISTESLSIRAPGNARETDPTLMSAPGEDDGPAPGEASEIYELKDIVSGLPAEQQEDRAEDAVDPAAPRPRQDTADFVGEEAEKSGAGVKATQLIAPAKIDQTNEAISQLGRHQRKMVAAIIAIVVLVGAAMVWIIMAYEPFGMASEEDMSEMGRITAGAIADDDEESAEEPSEIIPEDNPREVSVSDLSNDDDEADDEDTADENETDDETVDDVDEEEPAAETAPVRPRRAPTPPPEQPTSSGTIAEDANDADEEPEVEEERRGPPRLGL